MKKLGFDEWLLRAVMAMYRNSNSMIRVNNTVGDNYYVKVEVNKRSTFHPLLVNIVLEALLRECRNNLPWEMLYANDLVIIADSLKELGTRYAVWKNCMESKGLRVNLAKTKVIISDVNQGMTSDLRKAPLWSLL